MIYAPDDTSGGFHPADQHENRQESHAKASPCGHAGVVVGLDGVLLETRPTVRRHACGVGGPGSSEVTD